MEKYIFPTLMLMAQAIVLLIGLVKTKKDQNKYRYNPHPPGQAPACIEHTATLAGIKARIEDMERRLDRIEGKLNGK